MANDLKKGGTARIVITDGVDGETFVLPKGFMIENVITKKIGTVATNFTLGTLAGGGQIVASVALGAVDGVIAHQTLVAKGLSFTADQTIYIGKSAPTAKFDGYVVIQKVS